MTAAVLCPGPSLASLIDRPVCDVVIAVNRAALHPIRCDWWAFTDDRVFRNYPLGHRPKYFTTQETERRAKISGDLTYEALMPLYSATRTGWTMYTMDAAMILAAHLGAKLIKLYGCDWSGTKDFDGHKYKWHDTDPIQQQRVDERWKREKIIYIRTKELLAEKGVVIERYGTAR